MIPGYRWTLAVLSVAAVGCVSHTGRAESGTIDGHFFGDYYYVARSHAALQDRNGFQFRSVYLTYEKPLAANFSTRLRLEMNSPSLTDAQAKLATNLKHGYLRWRLEGGDTSVYFGLVSSPIWRLVERVWGYRHVAKTVLDMQKFGPSTDFGIAVHGNIDAGRAVSYYAMLGNGTGTASEVDKHKKAYFSVSAVPLHGLMLEAYGDFHTGSEHRNRFTVQGLLGYETDQHRLGVQLARQTRQQGEEGEDVSLAAGSASGATQLVLDRLWALVDRIFDPNPQGEEIKYTPFAATAKATMVLFGIDYEPAEDVHFIPNVLVTLYDKPETGEKPGSDIMPRLTIYYRF